MPTNFAVLEILPPNFFNCEIKYSFSKDSLASLRVVDNVSATEKLSSIDFDKILLTALISFCPNFSQLLVH